MIKGLRSELLAIERERGQYFRELAISALEKHPLSELTERMAKVQVTSKNPLPSGYTEIHRNTADPKSSVHSTFIYGEDGEGNLGYRVINGRVSFFTKLGKVSDSRSTIGLFLRNFPRVRIVVKNDLYDIPNISKGRLTGRTVKACIDILKVKGYIIEMGRQIRRKGSIGYILSKTKELGVENNRELEEVQVSPNSIAMGT